MSFEAFKTTVQKDFQNVLDTLSKPKEPEKVCVTMGPMIDISTACSSDDDCKKGQQCMLHDKDLILEECKSMTQTNILGYCKFGN